MSTKYMHTLSATRNAERTLKQSPMSMCGKDNKILKQRQLPRNH